MEQMTNEQLQAIEERWAKATPGPWYRTDLRHQKNGQIVVRSHGDYSDVANVLARNAAAEANAEAIAAAREDVAALLAELRRRRLENDRFDEQGDILNRLAMASNTLAAFAYSVVNPGALPASYRKTMDAIADASNFFESVAEGEPQ